MKFKRRLRQLLFCALITSIGSAVAATLLSEALNDLGRYLTAASALVLQASIGLDSAKFDTLAPAQRDSARIQLDTLKRQLDLIFHEQTTLVSQLDFFVKLAKDPSKTSAERKTYWNHSVLPRIRTVQEAVSEVRAGLLPACKRPRIDPGRDFRH